MYRKNWLIECWWNRGAQYHLCLEKSFFGLLLLKLSRIKCSQVMFMGKFGPTALNLGNDFSISQFFLGHPVFIIGFVFIGIWKKYRKVTKRIQKACYENGMIVELLCTLVPPRLLQPRSEWTAEIASQSSFGKKWTVAPDCRQGAETSCLCHRE